MEFDINQRLGQAVSYYLIKNIKKLNFFSRDFVMDVMIMYINTLNLNVKY